MSPAPPRRGANPWRLSETARKPEQRPEPIGQQLLEELMPQAPGGEWHAHEEFAHAQAPLPAATSRARPGMMSLVVVGFAAMIVMRIFFQTRGGGDWIRFIGPLFVIVFIAHALWRLRRRRESKKTTLE